MTTAVAKLYAYNTIKRIYFNYAWNISLQSNSYKAVVRDSVKIIIRQIDICNDNLSVSIPNVWVNLFKHIWAPAFFWLQFISTPLLFYFSVAFNRWHQYLFFCHAFSLLSLFLPRVFFPVLLSGLYWSLFILEIPWLWPRSLARNCWEVSTSF